MTEAQLANLLELAYDAEADTGVSPEEARRRFAKKQAAAIAQFVVGRTTTVTGVSSDGATVTGTGIIT
ncbi:hypothetical protein HN014_08150 [Aquimarina sp. TRL1]|uniref:hypothetical protein n=1 Tax=Aquimarina sp. (strain TRL1) TaxID=2736252 RepID=UPI00158D7966|nr:hypothetical protein [Aquimarina sp. TRL1]QKX04890.1 hypothetical protein HN014_08150 [Aquimarina sp. TRL1]